MKQLLSENVRSQGRELALDIHIANTGVDQTIRAFIETRFPLVVSNAMGYDDSLLDSGAIDSLGLLDIVEFIETEFAVKVDDDDMVPENFDSIAKLTHFVTRKHG